MLQSQFLPRLLALTALLLAASSAAANTKLLRFPDVHGDRVVFSYGGDLWGAPVQGGTAYRLTSHPGLELFAKFSPDGRWIAFTGQYGGDEQVYVMPASGGEPRQLTWYPATGPLPARWGYDHQVYGWTPDGSAVLFRSQRDAWGSSSSTLYTVPVDGGLPEAMPMPVSGAGTFTEDGSAVFYSPLFRDFRTWKRYEGGWAQDLWLFDLEAGQARQLTDHPRTDRDPMWIDGQGYFVSDRDGKLNLYRVDPDGGAVEQLTRHSEWDVRWASSDERSRIIYELDGELRLYNVQDGSDTAIEITVPDDGVNTRPRWVDVSDQINGAHLSPTGQRVLFEARGNLFNAPVGEGVTRSLTGRSTAHDREAAWFPDGQSIVFVSDISGEEELYVVPADGSEAPRALTSGHETRFYQPIVSPDGEHIAVSDKEGRIFILPADGDGEMVEVGRDPGWRNRDYVWAPAGDVLAFSQTQESGMRAIYLHTLSDGETRRISDGMFSEYRPAFSPDGQYLYYLGDREFAPQISSIEWNFATNRTTGIFAFALSSDAPNPFAPEDAEEPGVVANGNDNGNGDDEENGDSEATHIDFDGLAQRLIRLPVDAGNYWSLSVVEGGVLFMEGSAFYYGRAPESQPKLRFFKFEDQEVVDFPNGRQFTDLSLDGKRLLARQGSNWQVLDVAKEGRDPEAVATNGLRTRIDPVAEWATAFDEVWRRFRDYFYVPNMHGYDWEALREQYRPLLAHVAHRSDLNYVMGEMIGELNISHAYVSGGDEGLPERHPVALLGARFEADRGRYRISRILEGQNDEPRYRSPLTEAGVNIAVGDYLIAINGHEISAEENIYQRLMLPPGEPVALTVSERRDGRDARTVMVNPINDETSLFYLAWVLDNHRYVSEATDGRVGYLHIPDMGPDGIREFIKWYYGQIRKQGLVIDVRSNGGGNVSQMLIERLSRRPLALGYARTNPYPSTYPNEAFNGHLVALLDENSASDGDIFPWQFRNAGLGPLIGQKSWGGVVGITSHGPLIDGGSVNVPEFGFSDVNGNWVVEGEGVTPDIEVENDPASVIAGRDPQLERAIQEVMQKIESDPPRFPARPAPPVKTD
ncbi:S41 family peptidase [Wenzhouxiangella marina]|uniref:Tricorn protease homolog n=1 Tax=Wenzhouxiangella marina TaxID=1579979 RepID=A0A0K0XW07_9GAMM|nr:S41 family peptidase [Wenzhouxiangella marina]AKS41889.1 Peptidase S41 [Wenzhouxiangella marina]MBB6086344.1 tricorn protease [Wenzhouxiangella marina]